MYNLPEIFSKTIKVDAERLAKANLSETEVQQTNFSLHLSNYHPSDFFYTLHEMQHNASLHPDKISKEILLSFLDMAHEIFVNQSFTTNLYRTCAFALICLIQTLIVTNPILIDDDVLNVSNKIWKIEKFTQLMQKTTLDSPTDVHKKRTSKNIFSNLISARLILQLDESPTIDVSLKCLLNWIKSLIYSQLITIDRLSEMFVSLFQHEWNKDNLDKIRYLSKSVAEFKSGVDYKNNLLDDDDEEGNDKKSNLFLDFVADLAVNLEING